MKDEESEKDMGEKLKTQVHEPQQVKESDGESSDTKDQPIMNLEVLEKLASHTEGCLEEGEVESMDGELLFRARG